MRKLLVMMTLAILLGAIAYQILSSQQGYLIFSFGQYVVETSLWGALVVLLLFLLAIYVLLKCWQLLVMPRSWWQARSGRKKLKIRDKTAQGVIDYLEGNWPRAVDSLTRGIKHSETPGVNYLGAAAASFNLGDEERCQTLLNEAETSGVLDSIAVGLLRIRLLLDKQEYNQALSLVELLHRKSPSHPTVLRQLVMARKGIGDWHGLELLLPDLKKHKVLSSDELAHLELNIFREVIAAFSSTKSANKTLKEQQAELDHLWDRVPNKLKKHTVLVAAYIEQLQLLGLPQKAESRLRRFVGKHWDNRLAVLYGEIEADAPHQLKIAEDWLKKHPDNAYLLETLGRLCARCELWGKGKEYFEMSLKVNPKPRTWLELGELLAQLKDIEGSNECFRKGLQSLISNNPSQNLAIAKSVDSYKVADN